MFIIDGKEFELTNQQIKIEEYNYCKIKGYAINIHLKFKDNNIKNFTNKEYIGVPFEDFSQINWFEIFDTKKFLDTEIESKVLLRTENIANNKIKTYFELNDKLINIKFDGYLNEINQDEK